MFPTPTFLSVRSKWTSVLAFALCLPFMAKAADDLGITIATTQNGDQVVADVMVYNFDDILSMQFTIQWDPTVMQFGSVEDFALPGINDISNFGFTQLHNGMLMLSWSDPGALFGVTVADCSAIFRIYFTSLNGQVSPVVVGNSPTPIEIVNADEEILTLTQNLGCSNYGTFSGIVFNDDNGNCAKDEAETGLQNCQVKLQQPGQTIYTNADSDGRFVFHGLPGDYTVSVIAPENIVWTPCQPSYGISLAEGQALGQDFGGAENFGPSSASDLEKAGLSVKMLQNPVHAGQAVNLAIETDMMRSLSVKTYDATGKLIQRSNHDIQAGASTISLTPRLVAGIYLVKIEAQNGPAQTLRLVVR